MKVETITFVHEHCGDCPHVLSWFDTGKRGYRCEQGKRIRIVTDLWGEIPDWCILPDKKEELDGSYREIADTL